MTNLEHWNLDIPSNNPVTIDEIISEVNRCKHCILCPLWKDKSFSCRHEKGGNLLYNSLQTCEEAIREWASKEG